MRERSHTCLSRMTVTRAQVRTLQTSPMRSNSSDCKTHTGKRSIINIAWRVLFVTIDDFVTRFHWRMNFVEITIKFPCHISCDGIFSPCSFFMWKYFPRYWKCFRGVTYVTNKRSSAIIFIRNFNCKCGSCQRLNRVAECICCSEIDCVVAKTTKQSRQRV